MKRRLFTPTPPGPFVLPPEQPALAFGTLRPAKKGDTWIVTIDCPFCGKRHTHGSPDNRVNVGNRIAHCTVAGWRSYDIIAENGDPSKDEVRHD